MPVTEVPVLADALESRISEARKRSVRTIGLGMVIAVQSMVFSLSPMFVLMMVILPAALTWLQARSEERALERRRSEEEPWAPDPLARFQYWVRTRRTVVTRTMAVALSLVAGGQLIGGMSESIGAAGLVKDAVRHGEYWRVLTGPMLHGGPWHFALNLVALLSLGREVESLAGPGHAAFVLLASCICGSLLSVVCLSPEGASVGISGGLMGLVGFLLVVGLRHKDVIPQAFIRSLIRSVFFVAAAGTIAYAYIDNAAHAGGLAAGMALGLLLVPARSSLPLREGPLARAAGFCALGVLVGGALFSAVLSLPLM